MKTQPIGWVFFRRYNADDLRMTHENPMDPTVLAKLLAPLLTRGSASVAELGIPAEKLRELGFEVLADRAHLPPEAELLDEETIRRGLDAKAQHWLVDLAVLPVAGSTNALLNDAATAHSIHGMVRLAELQLEGRGRRGRGWVSPYANNLALSLGARLPQAPEQLGGFSLCVGLAVADRLHTLDVPGVSLKWPNDVLVNDRKIAGILIELHRSGSGSEVVIGVGINFRLPAAVRAAIDQPVTDLEDAGRRLSRNLVAAGLISSLVDYIDVFAAEGFGPMARAFDTLHRYHRQNCTLLLGSETLTGTVVGVSGRGELLLEIDGRIRPFHAGEVSLRPV